MGTVYCNCCESEATSKKARLIKKIDTNTTPKLVNAKQKEQTQDSLAKQPLLPAYEESNQSIEGAFDTTVKDPSETADFAEKQQNMNSEQQSLVSSLVIPTQPLIDSTQGSMDSNINEDIPEMADQISEMVIDFSVFKQFMNKKSSKDLFTNTNWQRLSMGLKYYESVCNRTQTESVSETDKHSFVRFCEETYPQFLDDFIQFMQTHDDPQELAQISDALQNKKGLKQCTLSKCGALKRHYRKQECKCDSNVKFDFFRSCYDRLHHHIFHLSLMGLRVDTDGTDSDQQFAKQRDLIRKRRGKYGFGLERYNDPNNKYNLRMSSEGKTESEIQKWNTFLDGMYEYITEENKDISETYLSKLQQFIFENEYDSDAIKQDQSVQSNISHFINNPVCNLLVSNYIKNAKLSSTLLSTGFVFYYWKRYKSMRKTQIQRYDANFKDEINNGYSIADLLVSPHYQTLKEEMTETPFLTVNDWNRKIILKTAQFRTTNKVKSMKAGRRVDYGIKQHTLISPAHVQCILLYCDWNELCQHFRATFHKRNEFESLISLKNRHSKYYFFAKCLVEAVNDWGLTGTFVGTGSRNTERGPFYCGLPSVMCLPTTSIYLKGPCSTTKNIETMINFSADTGVIVQLQNDEFGQAAKQRFFDCSWLSRYSEDNERLFIAGNFRLKIQSIIILKTAQNFHSFFRAFYVFEHMITVGGFFNHAVIDNIVQSDVDILHRMISNRLESSEERIFDGYVEDMFDLYLFHKEEIKVNMYYLDSEYKKINDLIAPSVVVAERYKYNLRTKKWNEHEVNNNNSECEKDEINLLNIKLFSIFPNLKRVIVDTTYNGDIGNTCHHLVYKFNLLSFLELIESGNTSIKYIITASSKQGKTKETMGSSWINTDVKNEFFTIKRAYKEKGWSISISSAEDNKGKHGTLTVEKISELHRNKSLHFV